jgi:hypothetical protein
MAKKPAHRDQWAADMAKIFSMDVYGEDGPSLETDIDEIEDNAVLAAAAVFDAVIARALALQNQKLPDQMVCPDCQRECSVRLEKRTIQGRMGPATIQEPVCRCSVCDRDFFPQREALRLDSQNLTPRARRKAVYAGVNSKSHGVGAKTLQELAEWRCDD